MSYLVEYSRNIGSVSTDENSVTLSFYTRSPKESQLDATVRELDSLAVVMGGTAKHHSRYPGWDFAKTSRIRTAYLNASRKAMGKDLLPVGVHAGLECGIICSAIPDMDAISIGPNTKGIHSPDEALDLTSCETFWSALRALIEELS